MKLTDELIQKYIDGELDPVQTAEVTTMLKNSPEENKNFLELNAVHNTLKKGIKEEEISPLFTSLVMNRITGLNKRRNDSYFILSIASVFLILSLLILGFVGYQVISSSGDSNTSSLYSRTINGIDFILTVLNDFKESTGLSIVGAVFSFGILVSGYFFFEHQKNMAKLNN